MLLNLRQIGQIALPVADVDRSEAFYEKVVGLPKLFRSATSHSSIARGCGSCSKSRRKPSSRKVASTSAARTSRWRSTS